MRAEWNEDELRICYFSLKAYGSTKSVHGLAPSVASTVGPSFVTMARTLDVVATHQVVEVRIILGTPRDGTTAVPQLPVEHIQPSPRLLGHSGYLLQQIAEVLDLPGLLAKETRLERIAEGRLSALFGHPTQPLEILQDALLNAECFLTRLDGLDRRIGPLALRCLDGRGFATSSTRDEVFLQPADVGQALPASISKQPSCMSAQCSFIRAGACVHREAMETDIGPGTIRSEFAVEHPSTQFLVDVASHGLLQVSEQLIQGDTMRII